ncbi:MAG: band 7 protein [Candidatus Komeilibacteria bacterium CG10_big_fil_rev_8_21_14_0_10_41_13]|uniref:Band 7 protein n=1 Tax=Candidatus Komeilibacteria bacterium CG10_big_fil_rev_8_21_14_0_10_41_13 TaxID=1974476 RepID=A0A2M6WC87_9BACT|nr:MAG: band 7 protein [Candidatus Komeilibacteria bacterium CG10_big_fil_rev_8_21_14_0_10_41_13]
MTNFKLENIIPIILAIIVFSSIFGKGVIPLIIVILIIYAIINFKKRMDNNYDNDNVINIGGNKKINFKGLKKGGLAVLVVVILIILLPLVITIIPAGETGVYHIFGKVREQEFSSGFHLKNPFARVTKMSIRTEEYTMSIIQSEGDKKTADAISALTKEGLQVDLDITVLYHLDEEKASDVFKNVGLNYIEKIIRPSIRSGIREVVANYEAKDIYSEKREEATMQIRDRLKTDIDPRGIIIEDVLLRNVNLPDKLAGAIQEKLTAEQEAQRYDFVLEREEKEAQRKIIEAEGQRDAQTIINQSLTPRYLEYLYIRELKDREGTIYVPIDANNGLPLFRGL